MNMHGGKVAYGSEAIESLTDGKLLSLSASHSSRWDMICPVTCSCQDKELNQLMPQRQGPMCGDHPPLSDEEVNFPAQCDCDMVQLTLWQRRPCHCF